MPPSYDRLGPQNDTRTPKKNIGNIGGA